MSPLDSLRFSLLAIWEHRAVRMQPARIAAVQERRLRRLLRYAAAHSPYYRDRFRGIDTGRCRLQDLPVTNKAGLMAEFDRVVTDPRVRRADVERFVDDPANAGTLFLGRYVVSHTSGSQGQPLLILQDRRGLDLMFAFQVTRGNIGYRGGPIDAVQHYFEPARLAAVASRQGFFPSASAWAHAPRGMYFFTRVLWVGAGDPDLIAKLNDFRPKVVTAYPSALDALVLKADRLRLAPGLQQVVSYAETLTPAARARVERAFGVPVLDSYATGECLFLSNGCHTGPGAHVNADWAILEVVDRDNRPVPPGRPGDKVLITNLANRVQPFIRYEIGDRVVMADTPCACGSRLPRIARVEGRSADVLWVRSGTGLRALPSHPFKNAFDYLREVREWQAVHQGSNRILVRVEMLPGARLDGARARRELDRQLESAGLRGDLDVGLEVVPRLDPDPATGKFKRLVNLSGV